MEIQIVKGTLDDLEDFIAFLWEIREGMGNPDWFYVDPPQVLREQMDSGVMEMWLAKDGDRIAGVFDLLIPGLCSYNYGYELGFSKENLLKVVNMDSAAVHPDYRGLGIQRKLLQAAENWLDREKGRILLCTIHPDNRYSLNNALKEGYTVVKQGAFYGSVRCLLRKDI